MLTGAGGAVFQHGGSSGRFLGCSLQQGAAQQKGMHGVLPPSKWGSCILYQELHFHFLNLMKGLTVWKINYQVA